ncbi:MAG: glycosyltransferase [Clostridiales bacterium]|nr:glycosyltransferase [Clostridiales bacterium]
MTNKERGLKDSSEKAERNIRKRNPEVSVIMPVYNASEHLRQCLDSVTGQTLREIEIICVDDGSTDDSVAILNEYAAKDSRIRVITQENAGAGAARNRGLEAAGGEYLSILDADDFFEPTMLEKAYEKAKASDAQVLVFRSDQYREDLGQLVQADWTLRKQELPPYRPMDFRTFTGNVFKVFVGWAWDKLFLREFVEENHLRFQEIRTSNDMLFVFSAIVLAERIEILDEVLAHQRRNNPKSLSNTREKSWDCFHEALNALKAVLEERGLYWQLEQDYINYALHFSLWHLNTITGPKKKELRAALKNEWFEEFGIKGKPKGYFYNQKEYTQYRKECLPLQTEK